MRFVEKTAALLLSAALMATSNFMCVPSTCFR